ncbi:MAG: hypothetical protein E6J02_03820 [Chloroflexi bacterium]|nr:MAG: hypothetical protein E6J02_03820 [Chloroflexota bacterium]TME15028.1 MAG: hypothetical protein E6I63_11330 [Chloroflexota bacterium]
MRRPTGSRLSNSRSRARRLLNPERWRRFIVGSSLTLLKAQDAEVAAAEQAPTSQQVFDPLGCGRPLRVLLAYSHYDYGSKRRGISYETTAFRDPLSWLGCDVIEARTDALRSFAGRGAGEMLLELAFRHEPDVLFLIPFKNEVRPEIIGRLRDELEIPTVAWFSDDHWRFDDFTVKFLPHLSAAVTTSRAALEKYRRRGFDRVLKSQWSANHHIFRPLGLPLVHDCSFIGQPHSDRRELVRRLKRAGIEVVTRGFGWPEGRASLREMVEISNQSRLCLNFGNASVGKENQVKGRDFEIPAMGRPMLTAASPEIGEYFSEAEVAVYRDGDDLVERVLELLADAERREALARAGHARFLAEHTAEKRLGALFGEMARAGWLSAR